MKKFIKIFLILCICTISVFLAFKFFYDVEDVNSIKRSRIFVTGNLHGSIEFEKLSVSNFSQQMFLTEEDNLIIVGDFGLIWDNSIEDEMLLDELDAKKFNILFVDGAHENFDLLEKYPEVRMYGGNVRKIRDNIYQLKRGEVYLIDNKTFFVMGGGISSDREYRKEGISYWSQEEPSEEDIENARNNLSKVGYAVDYVLSYSVPTNDLKIIGANLGKVISPNSVNDMLQEFSEKLKYKKWFYSYYHVDKDITRKHRSIFYDIVEIK